MKHTVELENIKIIMGLGNPGPKLYGTRHNIGYRVVDELAQRYNGTWHDRGVLQTADITINETPILLVKSNTYMNDSGKVVPFLQKKGIIPEQLLVIHDELEKPFGTLAFKKGGSHRGHNGLRSIISMLSNSFARLRIGIGRPEDKKDVPEYVLQKFLESEDTILDVIDRAVFMIDDLYQ